MNESKWALQLSQIVDEEHDSPFDEVERDARNLIHKGKEKELESRRFIVLDRLLYLAVARNQPDQDLERLFDEIQTCKDVRCYDLCNVYIRIARAMWDRCAWSRARDVVASGIELFERMGTEESGKEQEELEMLADEFTASRSE